MIKFSRRSTVIVNAVPVYHKEANLLAYAADKAIVLHQLSDDRTQSLMAHTDTVTVLRLHTTNPHTLLSAGLDGKIIHWDLRNGSKLQQIETRLPIFFMQSNYVAQEFKSTYVLRKYKPGSSEHVTILQSSTPIQCSVGGMDRFVACVSATKLSVYWESFGMTTSYNVFNGPSMDDRKHFTAVAAHPTDFVVATGNRIGEILIWYGLATSSVAMDSTDWLGLLDPDPDVLEEESDELNQGPRTESADQFDALRQAVLEQQRQGQSLPYCPVHPSRVRRNMVHWHCLSVQSLCFTPTGSHLLSGGLERVVVKWDMTECLGGPRQRRFLPRLAAPLMQIDSPGGASEDTIVMTLENNEFYVTSGAFNPIHTQRGFVQLPYTWRPSRVSTADYTVPNNLLMLHTTAPSSCSRYPIVLTNGAMGDVQLLDLGRDRLVVDKLDVTRQSIVPRAYGSSIPVVYSEVLLMSTVSSTSTGSNWLVTYERLVPDRFKGIDDQARITWWKWTSHNSDSRFPRFEPSESFTLSHLNCRAADVGFVDDWELFAYLLLSDNRLLIWSHDSKGAQASHVVRWSLKSCRMLSNSMTTKQSTPPHMVVFPSIVNERPLALFTVGLSLFLFHWSDLISSEPLQSLTTFDFTRDLSKSECFTTSKMQSITGRVAVIRVPQDYDQVGHVLAVCLRTDMPTTNANAAADGGKSKTLLSTISLDYYNSRSHRYALKHAAILSHLHPVCCSAHPSNPWLAVALTDGSAVVMNVEQTTDFLVHLRQLYTLPSVPAHPLCDRRAVVHRCVRNRRLSANKAAKDTDLPSDGTTTTAVTTKLLALEFLPTTHTQDATPEVSLLGLIETVVGRDRGRRDVIVYGSAPGTLNQTENVTPARSDQSAGILRLAVPANPTPNLPGANPLRTGQKRLADKMDREIEDALRQVSQYPLLTAPAPEQLLSQLMGKPNPLRQAD